MNNKEKVQSIFTVNHYINLISAFIIWLSGALFIYKIFAEPLTKIIFYSLVFVLLILLIERSEKFYKPLLTKNLLFLFMLILTAAAIFLYRLEYIGYPSFGGFTIFWMAVIYRTDEVKVSLLQIVIFLLSPVLFLEAISFSGIFALTMLVIVSLLLSERFVDAGKLDWKFFLVAFLFGTTLSAELIVIFIYIIYILFVFRSHLVKGGIFVVTMAIAYFLLNYLSEQGIVTLLSTQSSNLLIDTPSWLNFILIPITIYIGWMVADTQEVFFSSGIVLFCIYLLSFILRIIEFGWNKDEFDFYLLIMAIPFLVFAIREYKVDRFLGKFF